MILSIIGIRIDADVSDPVVLTSGGVSGVSDGNVLVNC